MMIRLVSKSTDGLQQWLRHWSMLCLGPIVISLALAGCHKHEDDASPLAVPAPQASQATAAKVRLALQQGRVDDANQMVLALLTEQPQNGELLELAGDVKQSLGASQQAYDYYQAAIDAKSPASLSLYDKQGRLLMKMGRPFESLALIEQAVSIYPNNPTLHRDIAGLQLSMGLVSRGAEHLKWLAMRGHAQANELGVLVDLSRPQADESSINYSLKHNPSDPRPNYGLATMAAYRGQWLDAANKLKPIYQTRPDFLEAMRYMDGLS